MKTSTPELLNINEKKLQKAFEGYLNAHKLLSELWDNNRDNDFDKLYPFSQSFDDLIPEVEAWVQNCIIEIYLNALKSKLATPLTIK